MSLAELRKAVLWSGLLAASITVSGGPAFAQEICGNGTFTVQLPGIQNELDPTTLIRLPADSVTLPKGCPIYALLVSGYERNKDFDELTFYKLAKFVMERGGYVHWAWWNNLLKEYMGGPLHGPFPAPTPGGLLNLTLGGFVNPELPKAYPSEDFQFQADADRLLTAIRDNNPNALIVVAGHSMGGDAVARLGANSSVRIDLLAPIDPVGNRSLPVGKLPPHYTYNWNRWRVNHDLEGFRRADCVRETVFGVPTVCKLFPIPEYPQCVPTGPLFNSPPFFPVPLDALLICNGPYVVQSRRTLGSNIRRLYHRWQLEAVFPFDYTATQLFTVSSQTVDRQEAVEKNGLFESDPNKTCSNLLQSDPRDSSIGCNPGDGHGEIVGFRGLGDGGAIPLGLKAREWPSDAAGRRQKLIEMKTAGNTWLHRPVNPNLDMVSDDMIGILTALLPKSPRVTRIEHRTVNEGARTSFRLVMCTDPDGSPWNLGVDWGDGTRSTGAAVCSASEAEVAPQSHTYADNGVYTVTVTVEDATGLSGSDFFTVTVNNVSPAVNAGADATINEGSTFSQSGSFTDPGADTWTATVNYGDGSDPQTLALNPDKTFSLGHPYADNGTYKVTVTVTDDEGGSGSDTVQVTVNNVPPANVALVLSPVSINENDSVTLGGSFTDPGVLDIHSVVINWGDNSLNTAITLAAGVLNFPAVPHQYLDDNPTGTSLDTYNITVTVTDKDGDSSGSGTGVIVNNVAPTIASVRGPVDPIALGGTATVSASFNEPGTRDTHTCTFSWDDGRPDTAGAVTETDGRGSCAASRTYAAAGVYTVVVTVTDDDTGSATSQFEFVVVYDPNAGFVSGGGWINSPLGGYRAAPTLSGRARFAFLSRYLPARSFPSGHTEFHFQVADFKFDFRVYEWLVVSGPKAQYKGSGTVNGAGDFGFLLTLTDGDKPGGDGVDRFGIKIVNKSTGGVVYDNMMGASDDMDRARPQTIAQGSIVIHSN